MFVLSRNVSAGHKVIATLLTAALLLWAFGFEYAQADNVQDASDLMTDTSPGADSDHTITFTLVNTLADAETIVIDFDSANGFDFTGVTSGDVAITAGTATFAAGVVDTVNDTITFTKTGGAAVATDLVTVHATGTNKINNPSPVTGNQSYEIDISAGTDTGHTRVVILDTVLVTANVQTSFEFTVNALPSGSSVNGETTTIGSSSTTIPFGTLDAGDAEVIGQNLTVETNAINGFVVTVVSDGQFESSTGADIDNFVDGSDTNTPTAWVGLTPNIAQENTWGHWGITTSDNDPTDGMRDGDDFAANEFIAVSSTTPREIFAHNGPADALTANIGSTTVAYKVLISALQEAADDYSTVLTYVATPTF